MRLIPFASANQVSRWAAHYLAKRINAFAPDARRPFVLGLPTGSTPLATYHELVALHRAGKLSFRHVVTFNMDEYVGLPPEHPQSYHHFMYQNLFRHLDIKPEHIHIPDGMADDPEAECRRYEAAIRHFGPVHLFMGGVGSNGHIAFNEPMSSFDSRTHISTLSEITRQDNARFFNQDPQQVPTRALTVGLGTLREAEQVMLLVTGQHKAQALQAALEGDVSPLWPISSLRRHKDCLLVCDTDATRDLSASSLDAASPIAANALIQSATE
ncbi:glucosamine-6-phosphate deaminase [uncultured Oceanisphaera sp.]|uniref:glucosamine-6-phosphate deaminase n=1 Tax=uncultured Oceanisphaera sp. TaxID=353858 RepID=UPI00262F7FEC|nr:glucosamine-6-phosphate deaminase [uncultured Oceanisphaera sp.]